MDISDTLSDFYLWYTSQNGAHPPVECKLVLEEYLEWFDEISPYAVVHGE